MMTTVASARISPPREKSRALIVVLASLAPVYVEDLRLRQYLREIVRTAAPDDTVRGEVLGRARQLDLPVLPGEVDITHPGGKLRIEIKYAVQMHLTLYQVDLHFHPSAQN